MLTAGSLFSGIGGLDLAAAMAGFDILFHIEFDDWRRKVLAKHAPTYWPNAIQFKDIETVEAAALPRPDVLFGGFPCQDVSLAGNRAGLDEGTRSGLWFHFRRLIGDLRPRAVFVENVPGLLSLGGVELLQTLPRWGMWDAGGLYRLPTPERRTAESVFSLWPTPSKTDNRVRSLDPNKVLIRKNGSIRYISPRTTNSGTTTQIRLSQAVQYMETWPTPTRGDGRNRRTSQGARDKYSSGDTLMDAIRKTNEVGTLNPDWVEMLMGFPDGWTDLRDFRPTRIKPSTPTNHPALSPRDRRKIGRAASKRSVTRLFPGRRTRYSTSSRRS